ncbi:MAG: hypothetical protein ABIJ37_07780 [Pseudomonadota bacterium]
MKRREYLIPPLSKKDKRKGKLKGICLELIFGFVLIMIGVGIGYWVFRAF